MTRRFQFKDRSAIREAAYLGDSVNIHDGTKENRGRLRAYPLHNECWESDQRIRRSYEGFRKADG